MRTIEFNAGIVTTIDQSKLPHLHENIRLCSAEDIAEAIRTMKIRGAPLLGASAAYALALTAYHSKAQRERELLQELDHAAQIIRETRPTAVNLFWALGRILDKAQKFVGSEKKLAELIIHEADRIADEDAEANRKIGKYGSKLIKEGDTILTHCNAGALATVDYGTALGIIRSACEQGKKINVIATETRPKLQGARLTCYELQQAKIPVKLVTDNMVGYIMRQGLVDKVIVGADRIVQDAVVNKIGTYTVAVLAKEHGIPFYVAAPISTFDLTRKADDVIIEDRSPEEVTCIGTLRIAPKGVTALNPSFDITPLKYVSAIICETGILYKQDYRKFRTNPPKLGRDK